MHRQIIRISFSMLFAAVLLATSQSAVAQDLWNQGGGASARYEPMTFSKLILKPDGQYDITVDDGTVRLAILDELRKRGYNIVGVENLLFDQDKSAEASLLLGGVITEIDCSRAGYRGRTTICDMAISWELFDRKRNEVIYKVVTRKHEEVQTVELRRKPKDLVFRLVVGALASLTSRPLFNQVLQKREETVDKPQYSMQMFATCERGAIEIPANMNEVLSAVIMIKTNAGMGSGFFISPDGLALTAAHVVEGQGAIEATTHDGHSLGVTVLRIDRVHDIALLKVNVLNNSCLPFVNEMPQPGTELFAIGAPAHEDLAFSTSKGIVSGFRDLDGQKFVQTDASINAGNSGGPLVNRSGEVIAIVSWKIALSGFEGLAFGVPVTQATARLAISPGMVTTVTPANSLITQKTGQQYPILDLADRPYDPLAFERARAEAKAAAEAEEKRTKGELRFFYGNARTALFVGSLTFIAGGVGATIYSWVAYKNQKEKYDDEQLTIDMWERDFNMLKWINLGGWVAGGIGLVGLGVFMFTPKRLKSDAQGGTTLSKEGEESTSVKVSFGFSGNGGFVSGRF